MTTTRDGLVLVFRVYGPLKLQASTGHAWAMMGGQK
jgi:hypothetical protein